MSGVNHGRVVKNTMFLYVRMLLMMGVSLYTSRVVLINLGVENFGIYNVVGGIVLIAYFVILSLENVLLRFINTELGKKNYHKINTIFSTSMLISLLAGLVIVALAETAGLWLLNNKLIIAENRLDEAFWVYQLSIAAFFMRIVSCPFYALICAYERMKAFSYLSILEVLFKLAIAYIIGFYGEDNLIIYAILMFVASLINRVIYSVYCSKNIPDVRFEWKFDKEVFVKMFTYSKWNMLWQCAESSRIQSAGLIVNSFFGVLMNAAIGIATQVSGAIQTFIVNIHVASRPQITELYAQGENESCFKLVYMSSKLSFFVLYIIGLPVLLSTNTILTIWLKNVPDYATGFTQLLILDAFVYNFIFPLQTVIFATGEIKRYSISISAANFLFIPLMYLLLVYGFSANYVIGSRIVCQMIVLIYSFMFLKTRENFSFNAYYEHVLVPIFKVVVVSLPISLLVCYFTQGFLQLVLVTATSVIVIIVAIFYLGLDKREREGVQRVIQNRVISKFRR